MIENSPASADETEPMDCVSYRLRRVARVTAKSYDNALRPSGLRTTQFTLLAALNQRGDTNIGELSEWLAIDATTLTRNLAILVRRGLVENTPADDARVRNVRLTDRGNDIYEEALPLWREAQQRVLEAIEPERLLGLWSQLEEVEAACGA